MILVTGHKGFIGRNIAEKIKVITADIDVLDYPMLSKVIKENKIDKIVHCAITQDLYENMAMLVNVLRQPVKRIITFGSGCQYNAYPKSPHYKLFKELQARIIEQDKRVTNLVLYGVYGKYEDVENTFISNSIVRTLKNQKIIINRNRLMSYVYIDDLVRIVEYFLTNKGSYLTYDIVSNSPLLLTEIARLISPNISIKNQGLDPDYVGNFRNLKTELPDFKFTSMHDGITNLKKYYETKISSQ